MKYWTQKEAGTIMRQYHELCVRLGYEPEDTRKTETFTELVAAMEKYTA